LERVLVTKSLIRLISLLGFALVSGCGGNSSTQAAPETVVFVGDSVTGAWNLSNSFPGTNAVNGGIFGYRTDQLLALLPDILTGKKICHGFPPIGFGTPDPNFPFTCTSLSKRPDKVFIFLGWNNLFQASTEEAPAKMQAAADDIDAMVFLCQQAGVQVAISTLYRWDSAHLDSWMQPFTPDATLYPYNTPQQRFNAAIVSISQARNVPLLDFDTVFVGQAGYTKDGVHPNSNGYQQMTASIRISHFAN
jgi:lysophospholipase L1-like esterase